VVYSRRMKLPPDAARALEVLRGEGNALRFEIKKACEQERWRLKVCYRSARAASGAESQLGLLWSDDLPALEALRESLEREGS
jgi:hypothetical protein